MIDSPVMACAEQLPIRHAAIQARDRAQRAAPE